MISLEGNEITTRPAEQTFMLRDCLKRGLVKVSSDDHPMNNQSWAAGGTDGLEKHDEN